MLLCNEIQNRILSETGIYAKNNFLFSGRSHHWSETQETSSVAGLSSICMAAIGKVAKVRGITLPFINYSEVNCHEAALKEQELSNKLVSINFKVSIGNN